MLPLATIVRIAIDMLCEAFDTAVETVATYFGSDM